MRISFFIVIAFLFGKTDKQAFVFVRRRWPDSSRGRRRRCRQGSISTAVRVRRTPSCSRSARSSAASTSRGPALPSGPARRRIWSTSSDSVNDRRSARRSMTVWPAGRWHGQESAAHKRPIRSSRPARRDGGTGTWYEALRGRALRLPGGRTSTDRNANPGGACRDRREQLLGLGRFGQFDFHDLVFSLDSDRQGQGERHPRFGVKPLAHAQRQPGAAKQPLQAPHQVPMSDQAQVSLLAKSNANSWSNHWFELSPPAARQERRTTISFSGRRAAQPRSSPLPSRSGSAPHVFVHCFPLRARTCSALPGDSS